MRHARLVSLVCMQDCLIGLVLLLIQGIGLVLSHITIRLQEVGLVHVLVLLELIEIERLGEVHLLGHVLRIEGVLHVGEHLFVVVVIVYCLDLRRWLIVLGFVEDWLYLVWQESVSDVFVRMPFKIRLVVEVMVILFGYELCH